MTDVGYTAIALLIDHSGSMESIRSDTEGAVNAFIRKQAAAAGSEEKRTIFIAEFDSEYNVVTPTTPVGQVHEYRLHPRGWTALHDAVGKLITDFGAELAALPEDGRPGNVVVAIMTDGLENSSREYNAETIKTMIERQQNEYNWHFLYMGANQDAVLTARQMGMRPNSSITYTASSVGTRAVYDTLNDYVVAAASGLTPEVTDEDRKKARG